MRFGKNNVLCPKYINIYEFRGGTWSTVHFWFIIQKTENVQEHNLYLNQILHHFYSFFFNWMNKKKKYEKGAPWPRSYFYYREPAPISTIV